MAPNRTLDSLDRIDRHILAALQADGRISNVDLANKVGLSPTPCLERTRRLERDGFIDGYVALLNPERMEMGLLAFVEVSLDRPTADVFDNFARAALADPNIVECHMVAGGFDYLMKVRVADMDAYRNFLGHGISRLPSVRETRTYVVIEKVKSSTVLPTEPR
ncbi:MAG: leucine-responsive transcriptional regulator [Rhodospirillales bacterium]|nr:leucine-responsive transcriptional regulator [Rhodospirillales bacterium]